MGGSQKDIVSKARRPKEIIKKFNALDVFLIHNCEMSHFATNVSIQRFSVIYISAFSFQKPKKSQIRFLTVNYIF